AGLVSAGLDGAAGADWQAAASVSIAGTATSDFSTKRREYRASRSMSTSTWLQRQRWKIIESEDACDATARGPATEQRSCEVVLATVRSPPRWSGNPGLLTVSDA